MIDYNQSFRHRGRVVIALDLKSSSHREREFESRRCRFFGLLAQLGERETEDLKVLRSIRSQAIFYFFN